MVAEDTSGSLLNEQDRLYQAGRAFLAEDNYLAAQTQFEELRFLSSQVARSSQPFQSLTGLLSRAVVSEHDVEWKLDYYLMALYMLAHLFLLKWQVVVAIPYLKELIELSEPEPFLHHELARAYIKTEQVDLALSQFAQVFRLSLDYLPAYEDLAYLMNRYGQPENVFALLETAQIKELTPVLFEELLSASSKLDSARFLGCFIELCVHHISSHTLPLLLNLADSLYQKKEYFHCATLTNHILNVYPRQFDALNIYVLSALYLGDFAPAIQRLWESLERAPENHGLWFKLGVAYARWEMSLFARFSFHQAYQGPDEGLTALALEQLKGLPAEVSLAACAKQILKQMVLQPDFCENIHTAPRETLEKFGLAWSDSLADLIDQIKFE